MLVKLRREPEKIPPPPVIPVVAVAEMKASDISVEIGANGTVRARTATQLTSRVAGEIIQVSPSFQDGGFFEKDEVLVKIDPVPYESQLANARAQLATAELGLAREEALAKRNRRDWDRLEEGEPEGLAAHVPQLAKARADVAAAEAGVRTAEQDLEYTEIRAPYAGRVRTKIADIGQNVSALGAVLAEIFAVDFAEVVLPLPPEDAWFLTLPLNGSASSEPLPVTLSGNVGGTELAHWQGWLDRSLGVIDEQNRFVRVIVRVDDPYRLQSDATGPPLQIGQFVKVEIPGRVLENAYEVPREAVLPGDRVLVVAEKDGKQVIEIRDIKVLRKESERVLVKEGLTDGDKVSVTRLQYYANGLQVKAVPAGSQERGGKLIEEAKP